MADHVGRHPRSKAVRPGSTRRPVSTKPLSPNRDNPTEASQGGPHPATPIPRVVVDTNVCLDLFLFQDPHAARLHADLQTGAVVAVTNAECRGEWLRVLQYPQLRLDDVARATLVSAFDAL